MKRTIQLASLILFLFAAHAGYSQTAFGLKAGVNLTNIDLSDAQATTNSRTGYHAGVFLRQRFSKIAVQPELLLFTQKNTVDNYQGLYNVSQSFTYVSLPLMVKFYPLWGLNIQVGPQFGFLVDGERKTDSSLGSITEDIKNYYKKSDISVSAGLGYDFNFGLGVDVRYNIGVQDINNAANGETTKSQVFLVSLGWNFLK